MNFLFRILIGLFACSASLAVAQTVAPRQETGSLRHIAEEFLRSSTSGIAGQVKVEVNAVDSRLNLAACPSPEAFMPSGARAWGRTTVGVRCTAPASWTVYLSANVRVISDYFLTAGPLAQGKTIEEGDIAKTTGDIANLPAGVVLDASQALGRTLSVSLKAGTPLRQDMLKNKQALQQGQTVKVVSNGPGFQVAMEARALTNAVEGQVVQARTGNGQVISGVAKAGGIVEVVF